MTEKLRAHFKRMQEAAANYLEPTTYVVRHPDTESIGACKWVTEVPMPEPTYSAYAVAEINARRDKAFISDMIYMLDGPEQREAEQEFHPTPAADEVEAVARAIHLTRFEDDGSSPGEDDYDMALAAIAAMQTGSAEPAAPISDGEIYSRTSFDSADHKRGFLEGMGFAASTEPEGDAQMTAVRAGEVWGDTVGGWEDSAMAAARVIEAYGDRRVADALKAAEPAGEEPVAEPNEHVDRIYGECPAHGRYARIAPCRPATPTNPERLVDDMAASLRELVAAMRKYEMDVDGDPPELHRMMMRRAERLIALSAAPLKEGEGE